MSEKELLQGLKESQIACYEKLIDQYAAYIACIVSKIGQERLRKEDMEEICADVFIKIWENRKNFLIKEGYLKSYLGAMARNKTFNKLRSIGHQCLPLEEDTISYETPEKNMVAKEDEKVINEVIETLPEPDREIFIRRYFYFEKLSEIAQKIDIPIGTVGTKLARGKKKLEQVLRERGVIL